MRMRLNIDCFATNKEVFVVRRGVLVDCKRVKVGLGGVRSLNQSVKAAAISMFTLEGIVKVGLGGVRSPNQKA